MKNQEFWLFSFQILYFVFKKEKKGHQILTLLLFILSLVINDPSFQLKGSCCVELFDTRLSSFCFAVSIIFIQYAQ